MKIIKLTDEQSDLLLKILKGASLQLLSIQDIVPESYDIVETIEEITNQLLEDSH